MAGDWLKVEKSTPEKPEVFAMSATLNIDPDIVFARLFKMWCWFDANTTDGNARGVTFALLDRHIGVTGFCTAALHVGWLFVTEDGISLPNFDYHNGQSAKDRSLTAKRVAKHRKSNGKCNDENVTEALAREEKRREEKNKEKDKGSTFVTPLWVDQQLWDDFIDMRKKIKKPATDRAKQLLINELKKLIEQGYSQQDVIGNSIRNGWQDFYAPKRMNGNNGGFVC